MAGRKPDFWLKAMDKTTNAKSGKIGAGWKNKDGSVSIDLEAFVVLHGSKSLVLTLFPIDRASTGRWKDIPMDDIDSPP